MLIWYRGKGKSGKLHDILWISYEKKKINFLLWNRSYVSSQLSVYHFLSLVLSHFRVEQNRQRKVMTWWRSLDSEFAPEPYVLEVLLIAWQGSFCWPLKANLLLKLCSRKQQGLIDERSRLERVWEKTICFESWLRLSLFLFSNMFMSWYLGICADAFLVFMVKSINKFKTLAYILFHFKKSYSSLTRVSWKNLERKEEVAGSWII